MLKKNKLLVGIVVFPLALSLSVSCGSKVSEAPPNKVEKSGDSVEDRLKTKALLDEKLSELNKKIDYIQAPVKQFASYTRKTESENIFGIIAKMLSAVKSKIPDSSSEAFDRKISFLHGTSLFKCSSVEAQITYTAEAEKDTIIVKLNSCIGDHLIPILEFTITANQSTLVFDTQNLNKLMNTESFSTISPMSYCLFLEKEKSVQKLSCDNLNIVLIRSENYIDLLDSLTIDLNDKNYFFYSIIQSVNQKNQKIVPMQFYQKKNDSSFYFEPINPFFNVSADDY